MTDRKKILIIGLDGFSWRVGRKLIVENHMPTLSRLVKNGCHGVLKSVIPCETAPAWSSFQTGCYPAKTGIFAFHGYSHKTRQIKLNSFREIRVPTIWELLSSEGKKVVSINMPMTSPPPPINGVIIPGLTCPKLSRETVHPPEIFDQYIKSNPNYRIVHKEEQACTSDYVKEAIQTEEVHCSVALELMRHTKWDVFSVQIQTTDAFQHRNWWTLDPSAAGFTEEDYLHAVKLYAHIDNMINKLIQAAGESTLTTIISDHGFCSNKSEIGVNVWLRKNGYLVLNQKKSEIPDKQIKNILKSKIPPLKSLAQFYGRSIQSLRSVLLAGKKQQELFSETVVRHIRETIDMNRSLAFCLGGMGGSIYIIDKTRKKETEEMILKLIAEHGPESNNPLIDSVDPIKDVSAEIEADQSYPDYMIKFMPGVGARVSPESNSVVNPGIINNKQTGTHEQNGIFVLHGPQVKLDSKLDGDIVDIIPTLLSYLGISIPGHMDGKVLNRAFTEPLNINYETATGFEKKGAAYSEGDQSEVEKQLRDLGYL